MFIRLIPKMMLVSGQKQCGQHLSCSVTCFQTTCPLLALQVLCICHTDVKCESEGRGRPCDVLPYHMHIHTCTCKTLCSHGVNCNILIYCHHCYNILLLVTAHISFMVLLFPVESDCEKHDQIQEIHSFPMALNNQKSSQVCQPRKVDHVQSFPLWFACFLAFKQHIFL